MVTQANSKIRQDSTLVELYKPEYVVLKKFFVPSPKTNVTSSELLSEGYHDDLTKFLIRTVCLRSLGNETWFKKISDPF